MSDDSLATEFDEAEFESSSSAEEQKLQYDSVKKTWVKKTQTQDESKIDRNL